MLGIGNQPGILYGIHESLAVMFGVGAAFVQKVHKHYGYFRFAGRIRARESGMAVGGGIGLPGRDATIALTCDARGRGVDLVEIFQYRADRVVEAVEIKPMEGCSLLRLERSIVRT